jgi:hypothetical protein
MFVVSDRMSCQQIHYLIFTYPQAEHYLSDPYKNKSNLLHFHANRIKTYSVPLKFIIYDRNNDDHISTRYTFDAASSAYEPTAETQFSMLTAQSNAKVTETRVFARSFLKHAFTCIIFLTLYRPCVIMQVL